MRSLAFGIDIGGTRVKSGLVDITTGEIISSRIFPSEKDEDVFLNSIESAFRSMQKETSISNSDIRGAGVSVTGFVHKNGIMGKTSNAFLPFLSEYPIEARLKETLNMPVMADSDGRVVCLGECLYGAGRDYERVLLITLGTGIGFCVLENAMIPNESAILHMGGHVKVKNSTERCYCGLTGCFEQCCSGPALQRRYQTVSGEYLSAEAIFNAALSGDDCAANLINEYLEDFCCGMNQFIYGHAPDAVIIGGGVANGLKRYADYISKHVTARCYDTHKYDIVFAELGDMAGVLGAAALLRNVKEQ